MVKVLFDTNILIDYLNNVTEARTELQLHRDRAISAVTWIEVMVGADARHEAGTRRFLQGFEIIGLNDKVADLAVQIRRQHRIKLPDAVVWASARIGGRLLVTRNTKDFPVDDPGVRFPYAI